MKELNTVYLHFCLCRAQSFAERLRLGLAVIHGEAQDAESDQVDGRHSPPTVKTTGAIHPSMEIPRNAHAYKHNLHIYSVYNFRCSHTELCWTAAK